VGFLLSLWLLVGTSLTHASGSARRSELLTPAGWEGGASVERSNAPTAEDELLVPSGWGDGLSDAARSRWGGSLCSELIVPVDWARIIPR
jgi:hypothetical protein